MRTKKLFSFFFLLIFVTGFISSLVILKAGVETPTVNLIASDAIPDDAEVLVSFNGTGDFVDWDVAQEPGAGAQQFYFNDTEDHLLFGMKTVDNDEEARTVRVSYPCNASTYVLGYLEWDVIIYYKNFIAMSESYTVDFTVYYSDLTSDTFLAISETVSAWDTGYDVYRPNLSLDANKELFFVEIHLSQERYLIINVTVWNETYYTEHKPAIDVERLPGDTALLPQESVTFYANISHQVALDYVGLQLMYFETGNTHEYTMSEIWELDYTYETGYTPRYEGRYFYYAVFHVDFWGLQFITDVGYFDVYETGFPASSYLSVYSTLDGLPLDSKDFRIYLGEDEEHALVNFVDYFGNWSKLFATNLTAGLVDNYLWFETTNNGLKTSFEGGDIVNTLVYNTLLLEVKVENPLWLNVMYNPAIYEKGYYLYFNSSQVGYWYSVVLPIFNFTVYKDVTGDLLYELGFWISTGTVNIANIRLAKRYDVMMYEGWDNYTLTHNLTNNYSDYSPEWSNSSFYLEDTNFNRSGFLGSNILITNNQTLGLNLTGNFVANWTFTEDTDYADPEGWAILDKDNGGDSNLDIRVLPALGEHNKVVGLRDDTTGYYARMYESCNWSVESGYINFWVHSTANNKEASFTLGESDAGKFWLCGGQGFTVGAWKSYFSGSWNHILLDSSSEIIPYIANKWHHITVFFDCTVDYSNIWIDGTQAFWNSEGGLCPDFLFSSAAAAFDWIQFNTGSADSSYELSVDAIDYSWVPGYFPIRNLNNTFYSCGSYVSPVYDLGNASYYLYQALNFSQELPQKTDLSLEYRTSGDNLTFSDWILILGNTSIYQFNDKFFQFRANLTSWGNCTYSPILFWVNLTYEKHTLQYSIDANEAIELFHNESVWIIDSETTLTCNLTIYNESLFDLYLFNFTNDGFEQIASQNYTNAEISQDFYNSSHFLIKFAASSTYAFNLNFTLALNQSTDELWNYSHYTANDYRLISPENRQNPGNLVFEQWYETLAIVDYFGNVLYRRLHLYSNFTDVGLSIFTLTVINNHNYTVLSRIERGLGVYLVYVVPPESAISTRIFATNYRVEIRNLELQLINVTSVSSNSSKQVVIAVGKRQDIDAPVPDIWAILQHFFFGTWYGVLLFLLVMASTITLFIDTAMNIKRRTRKKRKRAEIMVI
ncbi:MAG: hypothetical protein ACTSQI_06105 [Candidatus Helarchaeota archaeon]